MAQERLQKIIALAGLASRREAETWIADGEVTVNGKKAKLGDKADLKVDAIKVRNKLIQWSGEHVYYLIYKPRNCIAMLAEDPEGRPSLLDYTKKIRERVFPIGRMDFLGEGAMLLTTDGDIAFKLQKDPNVLRRYRIKLSKTPTQEDMERFARGGRIEGRSMVPHSVQLLESYSRNALIEVSFEGMGSIDIRKWIEFKGFQVEKIIRYSIGQLTISGMTPGSARQLEKSQVLALLNQPELAKRDLNVFLKKTASKARKIRERAPDKTRTGKQTSEDAIALELEKQTQKRELLEQRLHSRKASSRAAAARQLKREFGASDRRASAEARAAGEVKLKIKFKR
jgi:23S rRNA pseudouridine2605 synthase